MKREGKNIPSHRVIERDGKMLVTRVFPPMFTGELVTNGDQMDIINIVWNEEVPEAKQRSLIKKAIIVVRKQNWKEQFEFFSYKANDRYFTKHNTYPKFELEFIRNEQNEWDSSVINMGELNEYANENGAMAIATIMRQAGDKFAWYMKEFEGTENVSLS